MDIFCHILKKMSQRYNENKLCKNKELETNQRQKQPIAILSKEPKPAT